MYPYYSEYDKHDRRLYAILLLCGTMWLCIGVRRIFFVHEQTAWDGFVDWMMLLVGMALDLLVIHFQRKDNDC